MFYFCCTERRREAVRQHATMNGLDFLEVFDDLSLPDDQRQRKLYVHFLKDAGLIALKAENFRIEGGERIGSIQITKLMPGIDDTGGPANVLTLQLDKPGDFSIYTLRLVDSQGQPLAGFDPMLSAIDFSFKIECPNDFDCQAQEVCPTDVPAEPEIDYLAKDFLSFRQLMLDRMATLMPKWQERHPADLGVMLVELLAYVGDYLSYQQDAIASEAYLGTARRRTSVRRHARLVDYIMHDGCNARAWVQVQVSADSVRLSNNPAITAPIPGGTRFATRVQNQPLLLPDTPETLNQLLLAKAEVFEAVEDVDELYVAHNTLHFYTWGGENCCLPAGATHATLQGKLTNLKAGMVLIFQEMLGPGTGVLGDADPTRRHAVLLTAVNLTEDPLGGRFLDPPNDNPVGITEIEWAAADALPFAFCVSGTLKTEQGEQPLNDISVALGNILLVDHGLRQPVETLPVVPQPQLTQVAASAGGHCAEQASAPVPARFRPHLQGKPLTFAAPFAGLKQLTSASEAMQWSPASALPVIALHSKLEQDELDWQAVRDLLNSGPGNANFVVETENDGTAYLRFGDGTLGMRPNSGTVFTASYRVGSGQQGNVGSGTIAHILSANTLIEQVTNPLPARGGTEPESLEDVRQKAPSAFRTQERVVTAADYAAITERDPAIQRAAATYRWTGSWYTAFLTADRRGGLPVTDDFKQALVARMERYRMAGYDLEVDKPLPVSLEIVMEVCVNPNYFRSHVKAALLEVFSNRVLPDGRLGVFHPDNFTFGQTIYLSPLYAAALAVDGVDSVLITTFQRQGSDDPRPMLDGKLVLGRLEIARLENNPNYPERGLFKVIMNGGK